MPHLLLNAARVALVVWMVTGCASQEPNAPLRSPSRDYLPPEERTADGQVIGADNMRPGDKLEQGPRIGNENALAPGWRRDEEGGVPKYDKKRMVGGATDAGAQEETK